jgi:hypothetical protein
MFTSFSNNFLATAAEAAQKIEAKSVAAPATITAPVPESAPEPLFGNQWLALAVILAGVALFTLFVGVVGRYLASTHPDNNQ